MAREWDVGCGTEVEWGWYYRGVIKYLGSKRTLLPGILDEVRGVGSGLTVLDLFSGTSRVGHALKGAGYRVVANDHNAYAHALGMCYVQADAGDVVEDAARLVEEFNGLAGLAGYFTETFCVQSRFLHPKNGERVDAIREAIACKGLGPELEAVMLVSLMEAADRVDSTTGVQMAYLKKWAPRAVNDLELRVPRVLERAAAGKGEAVCMEAVDAAGIEADVAYIDPPYNQHSYLGNYHVWETLVRWDKPEYYGVACKRVDCRSRRSAYNGKRSILETMERLIDSVRASTLIVSFNDEGYITREQMEGMLGCRGSVRVIESDYPRYVGAKIGIHNPAGEKVGAVGRLRNTEYLFVVDGERDLTQRSQRGDAEVAGEKSF